MLEGLYLYLYQQPKVMLTSGSKKRLELITEETSGTIFDTSINYKLAYFRAVVRQFKLFLSDQFASILRARR